MANRTVVISQPTFLPWLGYFDLMDQAALFIALDSVQFAKRSWMQRNRIRTPTGLEWLTVPARVKGRYQQTLLQTQFDPQGGFPGKHLRSIEQNYRKAPFFDRYFPGLTQAMEANHASLGDLNLHLIRWLAGALGISTPIKRSSEMQARGQRSALLVALCQEVGSEHYLSTPGAADYLREEQAVFHDAGIAVSFHRYEHPIYPQIGTGFEPYASVIDLLFQTGPEALQVIRSGRGENVPAQTFFEEALL